MSCPFCEKRENRDYLLGKHANFCLFCGNSLHDDLAPTRERADAARRGSKVYMNVVTDEDGRRICPNCGAVVNRGDPRAVYCSLECQSQFNGRRQRERRRKKRGDA